MVPIPADYSLKTRGDNTLLVEPRVVRPSFDKLRMSGHPILEGILRIVRPVLDLSQSAVSGHYQFPVGIRATVAEELPGSAHIADLIQVQIGHYQLIFVPGALGNYLTPRVAEVTLPIELTDFPRLFPADPIDRTNIVAIGHRVGGLL